MVAKREANIFVGGDEYEGHVIGADCRPRVKHGMAKKKGAVGIVGLGIMGGAFAHNLRRRRLARHRL